MQLYNPSALCLASHAKHPCTSLHLLRAAAAAAASARALHQGGDDGVAASAGGGWGSGLQLAEEQQEQQEGASGAGRACASRGQAQQLQRCCTGPRTLGFGWLMDEWAGWQAHWRCCRGPHSLVMGVSAGWWVHIMVLP